MTEQRLMREIAKIYRKADGDMSSTTGKEWRKFFKEAAKEVEVEEEKVERAKKTGDKEKIAKAEKDLARKKAEVTIANDRYKEIVNKTTDRLTEANQAALTLVNNELPKFYADTYNTELSIEAVKMGVDFNLVDEATVKRRVKDGDTQLPKKKIDVPKDKRWNTKYINSQVTQGILNGESMNKIANRIYPEIMAKSDTKGLSSQEMKELVKRNKDAAIRNARTLVNGAENQGRQDRYEDLEKQGAIMKKVWIATGDERTRDWHLEMDGQEVDIHEDFIDGNNNKLEYPGDPKAAPETVYNCRCTMKSKIVGFKKADGTIINLKDYGGSELHKEEIRQEIERRELEESENRKDDNRSGDSTGIETREEAYETFSGMFRSVENNLDKIDEELLAENANQLIELNKRFGVLDENNNGYITASPSGRAMAYAQTGNRKANEEYTLGLSSKYYSDKELLISKEKRMIDSFYSMPCSSEKVSTYSITHEYGHLLEAKITRGRTDYDALDEKISNMYMPSMAQIRKVTDDEEKAQAKQIWKEIVDIAKEDNKNFSVKANLSEYGRTNYYEAFAETFANSQCGQPNELGNAMNKWLEREGY